MYSDSKYRSGRSKAWLKTKSYVEAAFLIAGVRRVPGEAPGYDDGRDRRVCRLSLCRYQYWGAI